MPPTERSAPSALSQQETSKAVSAMELLKMSCTPPAVHYAPARDADVLVIPRNAAEHVDTAPLGEAAVDAAEEPQPLADASLRRRFTSVEDVSVTPPSDNARHVGVRLTHALSSADSASCQQDTAGADSCGSREGNADLVAHLASKLHIPNERPHTGILTRRAVVDDEDGEHPPPSGVQTPTKLVRFPSNQ